MFIIGAVNKSGCILAQIQSCIEAMNSFEARQDELKQLEKEMRQLEAISKRYNTVKQQVRILFVFMEFLLKKLELLICFVRY